MLKVVETLFDEELSKRMFMTGLVYKLEDGSYFVTSQDGFVVSGTKMNQEELDKILASHPDGAEEPEPTDSPV